ncbi:MAG: phosphoribosylglycinamide formyltransferase [Candidatus Omnitrophica bacterium]|nr:phosphoribosylglycinamide formyltransferase [Candidatus Omnitrophota bacterium]
MLNIVVFCSGKGTNLQAIIKTIHEKDIEAKVSLIISDKEKAYCLERAKHAKIRAIFVNPKNFPSKQKFENRIIGYLKEENIGLIVLAGFMRMLSPFFVQNYSNKILNIHPSLLPAFKGSANAVADALDYGMKITGTTVHFVDEKLDNGPIVLQRAVEIAENDNEDSLRQKIQQQEHILYPLAIQLFVEGRLKIEGRRVEINPENYNPQD